MLSAVDALRRLASLAEQAGANAREIQRAVDSIFEALAAVDSRKLEAAQLAKKIRAADEAMRVAGTDNRIEKLSQRFGKSRARVYAVLSSGRETLPG
jgi:ABC-type transporter Mla subunit MlaD